MKLYKLACLGALLWLTGCASVTTGPDAIHGPAAADATSGHRATDRAYSPLIPSGKLQPITAAQAASRAVTELAPPADIWERIRRGYGMPNLESDLVLDREQWYSRRPDYMLRMTERSNKYLFHIVEELERRNMPSELALLPFIESAFNPQAVSSAKAAGIWQFMPATGKDFDLKQNAFRDDRRDVLASTRAALDYLQRLYGMFGDWNLALAAYNWGEGSVGRAIAKNKRAGLGLAYTDLTMPAETRLYVPKLQAVKNIVSNPQAFNTRLPLIGNHPYFQTVDIKHDIDVALVAKLADVTVDNFKALNPSGGSQPVILAAGTPQILLPWDNAIIFQSNLKDFNGGRLASWTVWRAPSTMNPAEAAKRVGMTEADMRSINKIPPRVVIRAGSSLLVPRPTQLDADVAVHVADNGQLSLAPDVILKRTLIKAGKKDSVAKVASRYRVSAASVAEWNNVSAAAVFKTGQKVVMFLPVRAKSLVQRKTASKNQSASKKSRSKVGKPTRLAKQP
ncbi:MAG: transglycosylase SLT domain-containing protein [Gammaproteobacteria bacterium]|uniref:transglycosylase SLT domain-containing protein n=1 Tax=Rhodoferax sp. TaxID=50421 RepID=UPI0017A2E5A9|nr:transglycosylase SLT domain-containing protein [Rhodoferax sp.]MBU3897848.1 transglycosylase SLT domain-containing protein [Gammaproteobacteria bacterium]MBA3059241.1 LysM peptidoglycan-binding domain-containing protein [Rhodoferax sp.]MBU3997325.1 transglycosylase SLT domain-containing protein [Gammaproteobacteria bacterium]MBU4017923.1 transglycosylase SLT domain-containing protein [Gammaproteobacteria bacterium]MBU4078622.1 transglycosylase SLT domain-containing protein [Gammaproteobacte